LAAQLSLAQARPAARLARLVDALRRGHLGSRVEALRRLAKVVHGEGHLRELDVVLLIRTAVVLSLVVSKAPEVVLQLVHLLRVRAQALHQLRVDLALAHDTLALRQRRRPLGICGYR